MSQAALLGGPGWTTAGQIVSGTVLVGDINIPAVFGVDPTTGNRSIVVSLGSSSLQAMQSITLQVGMSSIVIDPASITLNAMNINILGQLKVNIEGVMTTVTGSAVLTLGGGLLVIG